MKIWPVCKGKLAIKLSQTKDVGKVAECVQAVLRKYPNMGKELCGLFILSDLVINIKKADTGTAHRLFGVIRIANEEVYQELMKKWGEENMKDGMRNDV